MKLSIDHLTRPAHAAGPKAKPSSLVDETAVLHRCAQYRDGFKGTAVRVPAVLLRFTAVREWIQRQRLAVDVTTAGELAQAVVAGTEPERIVVHPRDGAGLPTPRAVTADVGRFVVSSSRHVGRLAAHTREHRQVLVDAAADGVGALASEVLAHSELDLVGLHCRLNDGDVVGALMLSRAIGEMSWIRRRYGVLLTQISLANLDVGERCERWLLRRVSDAISEVIDEACARHRFPRPALTLAPSRGALLLGH
jgi:diaminopimelate decarboxylase